jgi:hypothetical protein
MWPRGHPHSRFSLAKRLDPTSEKNPQNFLTRQALVQQPPNDLQQGLQLVEVGPGHTVLPVGMGDGTATRKRGEWRIGIIL